MWFQVTSIGGLKYGLPRGFTPMGRPTFQTRGNNRAQIAGRGKKTQMKVGKNYFYLLSIYYIFKKKKKRKVNYFSGNWQKENYC